jgi:hypothetical protein
MNFYKEYNKLEDLYNNNPDTAECFTKMSLLFTDFLNQIMNQIKETNKHAEQTKVGKEITNV